MRASVDVDYPSVWVWAISKYCAQNKSNKTCHLLAPIHLLSVVVNSGAENANEKASYIRSLSCLWGLNGEIKQ